MSKSSVPSHLLELAREASAPYSLTAAGRRARFGDVHDLPVETGQIWRAAWNDVSLLVLVINVEHVDIDVVAVTLDTGAQDAESLILQPLLTSFGVDATLWMGLRTSLPLRVLDEILDEIPAPIVKWLTSTQVGSRMPLPKGVQEGRSPSTVFDTAFSIRAEVEDDLEALRSSPALPTATQSQTSTRTLASILGRDVDLNILVSALSGHGLSQSDVMSLLRGRRPVTPDVVEAVARATGVEPMLIAGAVEPLPAAFVEEVDHPRWRPLWRERAHDEGVDEGTARLRVSYEMFALAARETGTQSPDWSARLAQFRRSRTNPGTS